ncbi:MAG: hypothetical protein KI790_16570 [Cyclobacteriaceae bacterium]|nr:hypothetical protein [Cyclobacteriaceae bacterium HetDA_MAG_MS6]
MKNIQITILATLVVIPAIAQSQWNNTGDNYKNGRLSIGSNSYWAPISVYSRANTNKNEGIALAFEGTSFPDIGFRFKANGANYYQVLYNGNHIQWKHYENSNYIPKMSLSNDGKLGLGVANPSSSLDIMANSVSGGEHLVKFKVTDASNDYMTIQNNTGAGGQFIPSIVGFHESDNRLALRLTASTSSSADNGNNALMVFDSRLNNSGTQTTISTRPLFQWSNYTSTKMTMLANGNLGIGTTTPDSKLSVNGTIHTKEVKVDLNGWSDFVFENDYKLRTLEEVEVHINEKGHLPEIPSEAEVTEYGINLGEMDTKLLQKIEELTLYLIEQNKELKFQQDQNQAQQELIEQLQKEVSALKNK